MWINKRNVGFKLQLHAWSGTEYSFLFIQNPLYYIILSLMHLVLISLKQRRVSFGGELWIFS